MKKSRFTDEQKVHVLAQAEAGVPIKELCRKYGVSDATFYAWRKKYGGLAPSEVKRLRQLEEENRKLKRLVADLALDKQILQDTVAGKL
jgi:putative transposase